MDSQNKVESVDRTWKIVYGTTDGPEGRALELLSSGIGEIYIRDKGVYTLHVMPCELAGTNQVPSKVNALIIGTLESNAELRQLVKADEIPEGGYLVRVMDTDKGQRVVMAGANPVAVIWAVADFLQDGIPALAIMEWDGIRYESMIFKCPKLGQYESRRAPKTPRRSVFCWAHTMNDYREYFRNLALLKMNEVILWNNQPPVNAREVSEYAASWGISVIWGFAWGWSTNCTQVDFEHLSDLEDAIVKEWREIWHPLGGQGIYFQSFTELPYGDINGHPIAETVVGLVNRVTARIRMESPDERIIFGLHAQSVKDRLSVIDGTDKSVEILWEDMGGFPFNRGKPIQPEMSEHLIDAILAEDREVGLVFKCMLVQDWKRFAYQAGPYVLGCDSAVVKAEDAAIAEEVWRPYLADWQELGKSAYEYIRKIQEACRNRPAALNFAANINGRLRFLPSLVAEMFWSADEPYENIVHRVMKRNAR